MPSSDKMTKAKVRQLAAEGRLVNTCFDVFRRTVYPNLPPQFEGDMKIAFFAGAAELYSLFMVCLDEGDDATEGDEVILESFATELEAFQRATLAALMKQASEQTPGKVPYDA